MQLPDGGWRTSFKAKLDLFRTEWFNLDGTTRNGVELLRVATLDFETVFGGDMSTLNTVTPPCSDDKLMQQIGIGINICIPRIALHCKDDRSFKIYKISSCQLYLILHIESGSFTYHKQDIFFTLF